MSAYVHVQSNYRVVYARGRACVCAFMRAATLVKAVLLLRVDGNANGCLT